MNTIKNHTELIFGVTLTHLVDRYMPLLFLTLPRPYYEELLAVAEVTELPIGEVIINNNTSSRPLLAVAEVSELLLN